MSRFYFNVRTGTSVVIDPDGSELPDLQAARREAIENARDAMSQAMRDGRDLSRRTTIEICDSMGAVLLLVPYTEAILPDD